MDKVLNLAVRLNPCDGINSNLAAVAVLDAGSSVDDPHDLTRASLDAGRFVELVEVLHSKVVPAVEAAYLHRAMMSKCLGQRFEIKGLALEPCPPTRKKAKLLVRVGRCRHEAKSRFSSFALRARKTTRASNRSTSEMRNAPSGIPAVSGSPSIVEQTRVTCPSLAISAPLPTPRNACSNGRSKAQPR